MNKFLSLLIAFFLTAAPSAAESNGYFFWSMDIDKGLSNSNVTSVLSDSKGMLWIGTTFGLNRYDRNEVQNYFQRPDTPAQLPGNYIYFLTETPHHTVWVSTNGGLVRYQPAGDAFVPATKQPAEYFCFHTTNDDLWLGGTERIGRYHYATQTITEFALPSGSCIPRKIIHLFAWRKDVLLLVTRDSGLWTFNCRTHTLRPAPFNVPDASITAAYVDAHRQLYLAVFRQGLRAYTPGGKLRYHLTTANSALTCDLITDLTERQGRLWAATDGGGICQVELHPPYAVSSLRHIFGNAHSLPDDAINCLYTDAQQNLWAGAVRKGAFKFKETAIRTYQAGGPGNRYGLSNKAVNSLCKDAQGALWIGTDGGGVNRFDPATQTFSHYPAAANEQVVSVVDFSPTELLVSIYNKGIFRFSKATGACTPFLIVDQATTRREFFSGSLEQIFPLSGKRFLFLGQTPYLYKASTGTFSVLKEQKTGKLLSLSKLVAADGDTAYLLQGNNLFRANLLTDEFTFCFGSRDGEEIQAMTRDEHGIFWIGTNRGLRSFDPATGRYAKVVTNLFERVTAVVAADGQLWIGAQNALFSYHIAQRKFFLWQEADGYLPNELSNAYLAPSSDPYLYIGGSHGLVQIKKSMAATPAIPPRITLADAVVDGVSGGDLPASTPTGTPALTLPWNYKSLQLKIISLEPDLFKKRLFRYTIEQHGTPAADTKVMETYQPILHLDLLPPGNYDVHVSCYTDHGNWSAPIPLIKLEVTPPWYRDLRFLLPAALLLLALLGARLRAYIRRKEAKMKSELDQLVQQTDHEKVQFLVNISHELRTPLTLIYTPLQKVIEKIDTETIRPEEWMPLRHQLANIHQSANRMKDIINMTLDLNRISDDENTLRLRPHALNEWVCSVAETFTYELQAKQITLVYALDDTLETVDFDDRKCESVLSNLLMNALKFTPEGSRITLSTTLQTDRVRVSVADQGIGLQHADAGKLFTRFYQGDHSAGGSGIGLSYARTLIEKHGGAVGAFNHTDRGATFYFELPLSSHPAGEPLASLSPPLPDVTSSFATTAYTVVVAEDNDELRAFLADALKTEFKAVYPAANGQEAWTMVTAKMPDLVLSDIMMPVMNGYELCQKVKTDAQTSHIPVVLLTARGDTSSTTSGYQQGADAYLSKPFDLAYLQVILRNQLRNRELMKNKYRALSLRLTPDPATLPLANSDEAFLLQLNKVILDHLSSKELNVKFLTEQMGMSRSPLYAKLKALTNLGVNDYLNQLRIEKACELLLHTSHTIAEISEEVGFEYQRYFSTLFKQQKGVTPTQYKLQHAAEGVETPVWDGSGN